MFDFIKKRLAVIKAAKAFAEIYLDQEHRYIPYKNRRETTDDPRTAIWAFMNLQGKMQAELDLVNALLDLEGKPKIIKRPSAFYPLYQDGKEVRGVRASDDV